MLPSSALPIDGVQKPVHQVHNSILSLRGGGAPLGRGKRENRILLLPCPPDGWQKMVSGVALFEEV
jgi:hypothetical protein